MLISDPWKSGEQPPCLCAISPCNGLYPLGSRTLQKALWHITIGLSYKSGSDLLSQGVTTQVSSALESLTSVFGMGTGVSSPLLPPETLCHRGRFFLTHLCHWGRSSLTELLSCTLKTVLKLFKLALQVLRN